MKEVIFVMASLSSRDPKDVFGTLTRVEKENIRCCFLSLTAEVHLFKQVSHDTKGWS